MIDFFKLIDSFSQQWINSTSNFVKLVLLKDLTFFFFFYIIERLSHFGFGSFWFFRISWSRSSCWLTILWTSMVADELYKIFFINSNRNSVSMWGAGLGSVSFHLVAKGNSRLLHCWLPTDLTLTPEVNPLLVCLCVCVKIYHNICVTVTSDWSSQWHMGWPSLLVSPRVCILLVLLGHAF